MRRSKQQKNRGMGKKKKGLGESVACKIDRQARHIQKLGDTMGWFEGNISSNTGRKSINNDLQQCLVAYTVIQTKAGPLQEAELCARLNV